MALNLNGTKEPYKEFYGRNVDRMPELVADGRVPMNVSQLMQRRLEVRNADAEVKSAWMDNYFDTGDGIAYSPDGGVKVVLDAQHLREMNGDSERVNGALLLTGEAYSALTGDNVYEFTRDEMGKTGNWLSKADVKAHPVWQALARDQILLDEYADYIFAEGQERFKYETAMGVYPESEGNKHRMRAWYVDGLGSRSCAFGWSDLGDDGGRFVGIAPEVLSAPKSGDVQGYTLADLQAVDGAIKDLGETVRPEKLKPFVDLREKL